MAHSTNVAGVRFSNLGVGVMGGVHDGASSISDYFGLKEQNKQLSEENQRLRTALMQYKLAERDNYVQEHVLSYDSIGANVNDSLAIGSYEMRNDSLARLYSKYTFTTAKVINNSVVRQNNFFTLNKGKADGLDTEMGIIGPQGAVGIITAISDNYAVATSLLNTRWSVSSKIENSQYFGNLTWDGQDAGYAKLNEIPYHVKLQQGDTVITSGYSDVFPEGVPIGLIDSYDHNSGDNFLNIKVKLLTNFQNLNYVVVVKNNDIIELQELEKEGMDE